MNRRVASTGLPPWSLAVAAMLLIQVSNALSVTIIEQVGPAGSAWLRMCFGGLFLLLIVRPNLRLVRPRDVPILLLLGLVTGFMTTFFLAALDRLRSAGASTTSVPNSWVIATQGSPVSR